MHNCLGFQSNALLASLSEEAKARLDPHFKATDVELGDVIYSTNDARRERYIYFPVNAIVSQVFILANGKTAEIAIVGPEGVLDVGLLLGGRILPNEAIVQHAGHVCALPVKIMREEFDRNDELRDVLLRYVRFLLMQTAQTAVCNRHHRIEQQFSRWLLMSLDRIAGAELTMTQDLIAQMLGVRRETVTEAAGELQRSGAINYSRGHITISDRGMLEAHACECYDLLKERTAITAQ